MTFDDPSDMHIIAFSISMFYRAHHENLNEDKPVLISSEKMPTCSGTIYMYR